MDRFGWQGLSTDPFAIAHQRIDEFLNIDIPLMLSRGTLSEPQLLETIGVLGLWMRAVTGAVDADIERAIQAFLDAIVTTHPNDPRPLGAKVHAQLAEALRRNPALVRMREHIEAAMSAEAADDPAARASQAFLTYATRADTSPDVIAYFDNLTGRS